MSMNWKYQLSDVDLGNEEATAVANVVRSKWLSAGEVTAKFESEFKTAIGSQHAVALNSCTAALHLALTALDIQPGDEVIVPSYTFVASANAILYRDAKPIFVDIVGPHDLNLDPIDLARKTTSRTKAIIVVHFAGFIADMDRIMAHAQRHDLYVVEDACHAIGSRYTSSPESKWINKGAGTIGHVGCFSFFANKNLVTGEGGMLVTDDSTIADRVKSLRSHGMTKSSWDKASGRATDYDVTRLGYNYRPTEITSAIGRIQLAKLDRNNAIRSKLVERYRENLADCPGIVIPFIQYSGDSSNHIFPILVEHDVRGIVREKLHAKGIQTSIHYPPVHQFTQYRNLSASAVQLPMTERVAAREITLPLHPLLTESDVDAVCRSIRETMNELSGGLGRV
jgi:dTDP-4-amino-4,6-dideoxygalactose transaminase